MTTSLYDISVASYQQILGAVAGFLEKGKSYCEENKIDLDEVVETRLYPDMLPFRFQIVSVAHHSLGTMQSLSSGEFGPPNSADGLDYACLQALIRDCINELENYSPDKVNALSDNDVIFKLADVELPFTATNFVLSFSHPNVYFHAATAYDILRQKGVPIGKRDFMGMPRLKS